MYARGGGDPMMILVLMMMCSSFLSVIAAGGYFYFRGEEGDVCTIEGGDPLGEYTLDSNLECTFQQCISGTSKDITTGKCIVDRSGTNCVITEDVDSNAVYETNLTGVCEFARCKDEYVFVTSDETCQLIDCTPSDGLGENVSAHELDNTGTCNITCNAGYVLSEDGTACEAEETP